MSETPKHIGYIDTLKGIAIILVVVGHALAWNFKDPVAAIQSSEKSDMLWWYIIYAFHMPLFFWVSGFLLPRDNLDGKSLLNVMWRRTYTLLIPFITAGLLLNYISSGGGFRYWFLRSLYELVIISLIYEAVRYRFKLGVICDILFYLILFVIIRVCYKIGGNTIMENIFELKRLSLTNYMGFVIGMFCRRYSPLFSLFMKNHTYTIGLILFSVLIGFSLSSVDIPMLKYVMPLCSISGIACVVYLAVNKIKDDSIYTKVLHYLGRHSLEIYILHMYFQFRCFEISEYALMMMHSDNFRDVFWGQTCMLLTSFVEALLMIGLSLFVMNIIRMSNVLSVVLFGRRN